ncbi:unnamed protein product [Vitrella brassicaformis CCMP3155]|uniref:TLDc domain-containing protein n=1 Tax=Vitrella brassicaformis (strain CCMP3155) TaxID=1169540 RepID=A0A0G4EW30_VITBC|nr:unnamed protein product [Vitrella brassicaformis CCMP3155]|eukprot:CEM02438.1 unnamed protein product [Vitrella brassicaformis CCMP3155]
MATERKGESLTMENGGCDDLEPLPFIGRPAIDRELQKADEALAAIEQSAKQMRKKLRQQAKTIKDLITSNGGQPIVTAPLSEEIEINVGGTVLCVPRKPLLLPGVSDSFIAYLLLHHLDGLPKDTDGHPFLDADPNYIDWLFNEVASVGVADAQAETTEIVLTPPHDSDSSSLFWHEFLFTTITGLDIDMPTDPPPRADDDHMEVDDQQQQEAREQQQDHEGWNDEGESEDAADHLVDLHNSIASLDASVGRLGGVEADLVWFHKLVKRLLATDEGGEGDEIKSVRVMGKTVSTTEATLARVGSDKLLYRTFHSGAPVISISPSHLMKVVDFARRQRIAPFDTLVMPPTSTRTKQIRTDTEMHGLKYEPLCSGVAGGNLVIETAEEWGEVLNMTGNTSPMPSLLYKSSRDTFAYPSFLDKVVGKSGLLFALRHGDTHRFGCFVDGEVKLPADPTKTNGYEAPVFLYALSGAYETPTKIEVPEEDRQMVSVAGTQGVVENDEGQPRANGKGTLAQSKDFTCDEMEVWQVVSG